MRRTRLNLGDIAAIVATVLLVAGLLWLAARAGLR